MARKIIIGEILNLIKGIGGNPNKFMGTKSNITFLGKGPKEALFQGEIDIDGLMRSGFPLERVISEAERAGGYVTANKLNDIQLQRLKDNLITLKKAYMPEPIANITDLATGTGDLTQEGLGSLRGLQGVGAEETGLMTRISERMNKIKGMSDEMGRIGKGDVGKAGTYEIIDPTAEKVSYASRFNPRNEVHVNKAEALLKDPQLKGVYTEAEVKNAFDFEGLYQSHFDKGQVDVAMLLEQAGHNIPQMRASARDALLQLMKKEKGAPGLEKGLRDFVDEVDFKYITEGGGGRAGDPINLMVKYFGKNAAENLPKNATKENINVFTDFIMAARDSRGRGINDPFFDRETIDFSRLTGIVDDLPPFNTGGRVGFRYGSIAKKALDILNRNKKNAEYMFKASDNVSPGYAKGDMKYNAELLAEQLAEDAGVVYDDLADLDRIKFYGTAYDYLAKEMGMYRDMNKITQALGTGEDLSGVGPGYGAKYTKQLLKDWNPGKGRKPSASGGLAKILEV